MKNIYLLPTDKPSKLYLYNNKLFLGEFGHNLNRNIYITSNEIKGERCWVINPMNKKESVPHSKWGKLVVLTTDEDLIKDGVQAINDEFLEWFVKNNSCESVEVEKWSSLAECGYSYHIIIPKEEVKQYSKVLSENGNELFFDEQGYLIKEEPDYTALLQPVGTRQETLEEASKEFANSKKWMDKGAESWVGHTFIEGAKWQQERMYSEEDLHNAFYNGWLYRGEEKYKFQFPQAKKDWFEQFKKK